MRRLKLIFLVLLTWISAFTCPIAVMGVTDFVFGSSQQWFFPLWLYIIRPYGAQWETYLPHIWWVPVLVLIPLLSSSIAVLLASRRPHLLRTAFLIVIAMGVFQLALPVLLAPELAFAIFGSINYVVPIPLLSVIAIITLLYLRRLHEGKAEPLSRQQIMASSYV